MIFNSIYENLIQFEQLSIPNAYEKMSYNENLRDFLEIYGCRKYQLANIIYNYCNHIRKKCDYPIIPIYKQ